VELELERQARGSAGGQGLAAAPQKRADDF
jgi:multidrug efflux pump